MAGGYAYKPEGVQAIAAEFRSLQNQIDALRKGLVGLGLQIDPNGNLIFSGATGNLLINNGGALAVVDPNAGHVVLEVGSVGFNDGSGRKQGAVIMNRADDGSAALQLVDGGTAPGHTFRQALQWFDRSGNIVMADDDTGDGLARPHLTVGPLTDTNVTKWPGGYNTTWTTISSCFVENQNPRLSWSIYLYSPASTTTQFRLLVGGIQIGTTQTVTNAIAQWTDVQSVPSGVAFGQQALLELQCIATAGTGAAAGQQLFLEGVQN